MDWAEGDHCSGGVWIIFRVLFVRADMINHMSFALTVRPVISATGPADTGGSPRVPRLARADAPPAAPERARIDLPPLPEVFEEQDAERWDGMA